MAYPATGEGPVSPPELPDGPYARPTPLPPRTGRPSRRSHRTTTAVVVGAVVVVVVVGLLWSGVVPGFNSKPKATTFSVTFDEAGLPAGSSWTVTLGGVPQSSTDGSISFSEADGIYPYTVGVAEGLAPQPDSGSVTVSSSSSVQAIAFGALPSSEYELTFTEQGLPAGTAWSVSLEATVEASTGTTISYAKTNGTYSFGLSTVTGYTATPGSGLLTVSGGPVTQRATYIQQNGGGAHPLAFGAAQSLAQGAANANGTGWFPIVAQGVLTPVPYTNSSPPSLNAGCPYEGGLDAWPVLAPLTGNYYDGLVSAWVFQFYQNASRSLLGVYVAGDQALIVGTVDAPTCVGDRGNYTAFPSETLDSPDLATLLEYNDTPWVEGHTDASASYTLVAGHSVTDNASVGAEWTVRFSNCDTSGGGTGDNFTAVANATSGVVSLNQSASGIACGPAPFLPRASPEGDPVEGSAAPPPLSVRRD
jgi:hypothetical protein